MKQTQLFTCLSVFLDFGLSKSLKLARPNPDASTHSSSGRKSLDCSVDSNSNSMLPIKRALASAPAYKLTGETGSYRFMAPEVFRHEQYNNKVDVYGEILIYFYDLRSFLLLISHL